MKRFYLIPLILVSVTYSWAQKKSTPAPVVKKPLTHDVYDSWKEITYRAITNDSQFAVYTINPQDGDGKVVFQNLKSLAQDSIHRAADIALTWDSRHFQNQTSEGVGKRNAQAEKEAGRDAKRLPWHLCVRCA